MTADALVKLLANLSYEQVKEIFWEKCPECDYDTKRCYNCKNGVVLTEFGAYLESRMKDIAETEAEKERDIHERCHHD